MTEIIIKKNQNEDEYVGFSQSVQRYHRYDVYLDNLSGDKETDKRYYAEAWSRQLITLARMDEDEYQELQNSLENHIAQKRISVKVLHEMLLDIAKNSSDGKLYTYCVESVIEDMCNPLAVFTSKELDEARRFASEAYENRTDDSSIQISEGLFDSEGNMRGGTIITFVIESWQN